MWNNLSGIYPTSSDDDAGDPSRTISSSSSSQTAGGFANSATYPAVVENEQPSPSSYLMNYGTPQWTNADGLPVDEILQMSNQEWEMRFQTQGQQYPQYQDDGRLQHIPPPPPPPPTTQMQSVAIPTHDANAGYVPTPSMMQQSLPFPHYQPDANDIFTMSNPSHQGLEQIYHPSSLTPYQTETEDMLAIPNPTHPSPMFGEAQSRDRGGTGVWQQELPRVEQLRISASFDIPPNFAAAPPSAVVSNSNRYERASSMDARERDLRFWQEVLPSVEQSRFSSSSSSQHDVPANYAGQGSPVPSAMLPPAGGDVPSMYTFTNNQPTLLPQLQIGGMSSNARSLSSASSAGSSSSPMQSVYPTNQLPPSTLRPHIQITGSGPGSRRVGMVNAGPTYVRTRPRSNSDPPPTTMSTQPERHRKSHSFLGMSCTPMSYAPYSITARRSSKQSPRISTTTTTATTTTQPASPTFPPPLPPQTQTVPSLRNSRRTRHQPQISPATYELLDTELLNTNINRTSVSSLRDLLRARHLPCSGNKPLLIQRLEEEVELIRKRREGTLREEDDPRSEVFWRMGVLRRLEGLRRFGGNASGSEGSGSEAGQQEQDSVGTQERDSLHINNEQVSDAQRDDGSAKEEKSI